MSIISNYYFCFIYLSVSLLYTEGSLKQTKHWVKRGPVVYYLLHIQQSDKVIYKHSLDL